MKRRVKITTLPKAGQGLNVKQFPWPGMNGGDGKPHIQVGNTLQPVDEKDANIEAEKGETLLSDMNFDGINEHYTIGGKRHSEGGTSLHVPNDAFIFSDTKDMKIKDEDILKMFGMTGAKKGYTPATVAKKYDINKFQKVLSDPDTDALQRKTAESMIANYNLKLAKLSLVQESKKGFPNGIPKVAMPYLETSKVDPSKFMMNGEDTQGQAEQPAGNVAQFGGEMDYFQDGGSYIVQKFIDDHVRAHNPQYFQQGGSKTTTRVQSSNPGYDAPVYSTPPTTKKVLDLPKDAKIKQLGDQDLAVGDYVNIGGKVKKVTSLPPKSDFTDQRLGKLQNEFGVLQNTIKDPGLQDKIYENYKQHIKDSKISPDRKDKLLNTPKEEVINNYLNYQKQTYAIHNGGIDLTSKDAAKWDTNASGKNQVYKDTAKKLGFKDNEILTNDQIAMAQAAHRGITDASQDPQYKDKLSAFGTQLNKGMGDQTYQGKNISPVDDWFGNTTAGQAFVPKGQDPGLEDVAQRDETTPGVLANKENIAPPVSKSGNAPWWLQDIVKSAGAAGDQFRVKKYNPWQATPGVNLADATFYDPTRELASNAEQMNIMAQGLSSFTGPQSYIANMSAAQGQGAKNAADIMGRYNNLNVGLANAKAASDSNTMNQASANKAGLDTQLFDKYTIVNQQFDNSKNMARQNLRQSYMDAVTNKNYTANLNDLYPQYNIDPSIGGRINFTHGRALNPEMPEDKVAKINATANQFMEMNPGLDRKDALNHAMKLHTGQGQEDDKMAYLKAMMSGQQLQTRE